MHSLISPGNATSVLWEMPPMARPTSMATPRAGYSRPMTSRTSRKSRQPSKSHDAREPDPLGAAHTPTGRVVGRYPRYEAHKMADPGNVQAIVARSSAKPFV